MSNTPEGSASMDAILDRVQQYVQTGNVQTPHQQAVAAGMREEIQQLRRRLPQDGSYHRLAELQQADNGLRSMMTSYENSPGRINALGETLQSQLGTAFCTAYLPPLQTNKARWETMTEVVKWWQQASGPVDFLDAYRMVKYQQMKRLIVPLRNQFRVDYITYGDLDAAKREFRRTQNPRDQDLRIRFPNWPSVGTQTWGTLDQRRRVVFDVNRIPVMTGSNASPNPSATNVSLIPPILRNNSAASADTIDLTDDADPASLPNVPDVVYMGTTPRSVPQPATPLPPSSSSSSNVQDTTAQATPVRARPGPPAWQAQIQATLTDMAALDVARGPDNDRRIFLADSISIDNNSFHPRYWCTWPCPENRGCSQIGWLNDEIIGGLLRYYARHGSNTYVVSPVHWARWVRRLKETSAGRTTVNAPPGIPSWAQRIVIPLNLSGAHWTLGWIDLEHRWITEINSLRPRRTNSEAVTLMRHLLDGNNVDHAPFTNPSADDDRFRIHRQQNTFDCGLWVLAHAQHLIDRGRTHPALDPGRLRNWILLDLARAARNYQPGDNFNIQQTSDGTRVCNRLVEYEQIARQLKAAGFTSTHQVWTRPPFSGIAPATRRRMNTQVVGLEQVVARWATDPQTVVPVGQSPSTTPLPLVTSNPAPRPAPTLQPSSNVVVVEDSSDDGTGKNDNDDHDEDMADQV